MANTASESMINGGSVLSGMRATLGTWELWITINEKTVMKDPVLNPVHPGEILLKDFLEPLAISQSRLAKDVHVPLGRIKELVLERRGISADTALRLARYFNTTPQFWLNLQTKFDLDTARLTEEKTILRTIQPSSALAAVA
jgi:addiction module HigA family antidote